MDSWTKWTEAYPLRNKEAETVAKVLVEQVFTRFGVPLSILSDQGKEVDGRITRGVPPLRYREATYYAVQALDEPGGTISPHDE